MAAVAAHLQKEESSFPREAGNIFSIIKRGVFYIKMHLLAWIYFYTWFEERVTANFGCLLVFLGPGKTGGGTWGAQKSWNNFYITYCL